MSQPRISQLSIWERHEKRVLDILLVALSLLQKKRDLVESEVGLNRELYFCLLEANRVQWLEGKGFDNPPVGEGKNPPSPDDEQRAKREDKIPDFYWGLIDHTEVDPRYSARYFVIECKRLGEKLRSDWVLNENYVQHGIRRFITEEHGYAKGEKSGAMVGYVQSMKIDDILNEVNNVLGLASIPMLTLLTEAWPKQGTSMLEHLLTRPFSSSLFFLRHFWVDLQACYVTSTLESSQNKDMQQVVDIFDETLQSTESNFNLN